MSDPYYNNLAEEISWFLHVNERERVCPIAASEWRREVESVVTRVLNSHGILITNSTQAPANGEKDAKD